MWTGDAPSPRATVFDAAIARAGIPSPKEAEREAVFADDLATKARALATVNVACAAIKEHRQASLRSNYLMSVQHDIKRMEQKLAAIIQQTKQSASQPCVKRLLKETVDDSKPARRD